MTIRTKRVMHTITAGVIGLLASASVSAKILDRVAVIVDDSVIMESEVDRRIESVKNNFRQNKAQLPPEEILRKQLLDQMILESIQMQMADRMGLRMSDQQLNQIIERIASQNKMTVDQFKASLAKDGIIYEDFREQVRLQQITQELQRIQIGGKLRITDQDIDGFLASQDGKQGTSGEYKLRHILIQVPRQATTKELDDARAKANRLVKSLREGADFAQTAIAESDGQNALKGGDIGWRKGIELPTIFSRTVPSMEVNAVSEPIRSGSGFHIVKLEDKRGGATKMVEQSKVRHILIQPNEIRDEKETEKLIKEIYKRIQKGEDFATLAKELSDDPGSGSLGGDLGWVNKGDMVPAFEQTYLNAKIGKVSKPFKSQFGWHILEVTDRRTADVGEKLQRQQARQIIWTRRFEEELPIWLRQIRSDAYIKVKEL